MLGFWFFGATALAITLWLLLKPLLRPAPMSEDDAQKSLAMYRAQLEEIERDEALSLITQAEAKSARLEIERRILSLAQTDKTSLTASPALRMIALAMVGALPIIVIILYRIIGEPALMSMSMDTWRTAQATQQPTPDQMIQALETRTAQKPDDAEGWSMLAQAYTMMRRFEDAETAIQKAIALSDQNAAFYAFLGEAQTMAAGQIVTDEAYESFNTALSLQSFEPRALFYKGLYAYQQDNPRAALDIWADVVRNSDAEAAYLDGVRSQMRFVAEEAGLDLNTLYPDLAQDAEPAINLQEQQEMIAGMVDGLAARLQDNPDDLEGWTMLARSYTVLQRYEEAIAALREVIRLDPNNQSAKDDLARLEDLISQQTSNN